MRIKVIFIGLLVLITGCNQSKQPDEDTADTGAVDDRSDAQNLFIYTPKDAFWEYQYDTTIQDFKPVKVREIPADSLTTESVESIVNNTWPNVQVSYQKTSGDTVFLEIPESAVLTQQMGTAGAKQFLVSTTYSFTELSGVHYVAFDFEEGDHAVPGVYSRKSFR